MSPPEIWGPPVWILFHTLIEKLNPYLYSRVIHSMFDIIVKICRVLPCPNCSNDASNFLAKINLNEYKTKEDFKNMLYLFHNWVNAKKRKPLYNYSNMNNYSKLNLISVINNFITKYNTKGNMKLLTESFQRNFVIKDFMNWFKKYSRAFMAINQNYKQIKNHKKEEEKQIVEEQQQIVEEQQQIVEEEKQIVEEETPGIEEQQQIVEEEKPVVEEKEHANKKSKKNHKKPK